MSRSRSPSSDRYHHGELRPALLAAARELAGEVGVDALSLREVARRAGVSHAAPYHHFADRAALLRALAADAFEHLTARLRAAALEPTSPRERLEAVGVAYVRFALDRSVEFRFMFRPELCAPEDDVDGALARANRDASQVLADVLAECSEAGLLPASTLPIAALTAWSTVHGLAELLLTDPSRARQGMGRKSSERVAREVIAQLLQGLLRP